MFWTERWLSDHASKISLSRNDEDRKWFDCATDEIIQKLNSKDAWFKWSFKRIVRSGSLERGTAVRGHVDVDLVCFVEMRPEHGLNTPDDFIRLRKEILHDIAKKFGQVDKWELKWKPETETEDDDKFTAVAWSLLFQLQPIPFVQWCWRSIGLLLRRVLPFGDDWSFIWPKPELELEGMPNPGMRSFSIGIAQIVTMFNWHNEYVLSLKLAKARANYWFSILDSQLDTVNVDITLGLDLFEQFSSKTILGESNQSSDVSQEFGADLETAYDWETNPICAIRYLFDDRELSRSKQNPSLSDVFRAFDATPKYGEEFSASLADVQRDFMNEHLKGNRDLIDLILLAKSWIKETVRPRHPELKFPSYLMELICLQLWKQYSWGEPDGLSHWFQRLMTTLVNYQYLDCAWEDLYSRDRVPHCLRAKGKPLVVDPANPHNNVALPVLATFG